MSHKVTLALTFWGDHRTVAQHAAHDVIEQRRWQWRVRALEQRKRALRPKEDFVPHLFRRQGL